jgi:hypothetical protein
LSSIAVHLQWRPVGEQPHGFWWMVALIGALTGLVAWRVVKRLRPRRL